LHLAARSGSLDVASCLVAAGANLLLTDRDGRTAIHCAAYYDQENIVLLIARKNPGVLELLTKNE